MTITTKFALQLVATRCLALFFYNFKDEHIKQIREKNRNFDYAWSKLLAKSKNEKWDHIYDYRFWELYSGLDLEAQGVVMEKAYEIYEAEVFKNFGL